MLFRFLLLSTILCAAPCCDAAAYRIVMLGDSITKGVRTGVANNETFAAQSEVALRKLGLDCEVINTGIGGERSDQALRRLDNIVAMNPQLVTIMYGTNDSYIDKGKQTPRISIQEFRDNLQLLVRRLREAGICPVLMTEPRWAKDRRNGAGEDPNRRLERWMRECRLVARELDVPLIDHFADWTNAERGGQVLQDWTTDGLHPNAVGHGHMSEQIVPLLASFVRSATKTSTGASNTLAQLKTGEAVRVVCFGDSVTGLYYHTGGRRAYTDLLGTALRRLCPRADVTMFNAGVSGDTTARGLSRMQENVLAKNPTLVTVMFGLNDIVATSKTEYRSNLNTIIDRAEAAGAEVILCTPNAVTTTGSRPVEKLERYCEIIRQIAHERNVLLCDSYSQCQAMMQQDPLAWRLTMSDEFHPNCNGHKMLAEQIAATITGRTISLKDVRPLAPALSFCRQAIRDDRAVRILAMPPTDQSVTAAFQSAHPNGQLEVTRWETADRTLPALMNDAKARVRKQNPNLVVISVPRTAAALSQEEFIHSYAWLMNWSLSFSHATWDVVVVHPDVTDDPHRADAAETEEIDTMIRTLVRAQDLPLIDRVQGDNREAAKIVEEWFRAEVADER